MKSTNFQVVMLIVCLLLAPTVWAEGPAFENQSAASPTLSTAAAEVPPLIKFSGTLLDEQGQALKGPVGVTFALYVQQSGGAALWMETQNVKPDSSGNYTILLGANSTNGVPAELFVSGEARWLGIQVGQQPERERILLVSVPYALKAGDAETLGGLPASAFVTTGLANTANSANSAAASPSAAGRVQPTQGASEKTSATPQVVTPCSSVTSDGAANVNSIGLFTTPCNIESSLMTQTLVNGFPGINLAGNNAGLLLNGTGTHQITVTSATTGVSGRLGQDANGFFFASDTKGKSVRFLTNNGTLNEWMRITSAGNIGIGTTTPATKLDVNGNQNIAGNLNVSGTFSLPLTTSPTTGTIIVNGFPFLNTFGSFNTFLGAGSGNFTTTGSGNTALGINVLASNTTGGNNTATGLDALLNNTTGSNNTANGLQALQSNSMGSSNTAVGFQALEMNTADGNTAVGAGALTANTASFNTAVGDLALNLNTTGGANTAVGESALTANTTGNDNTALGAGALAANTGSGNTAVGDVALTANTTGNDNTAVGFQALLNATGSGNIAIGSGAGAVATIGSNNIYIGSDGVAAEGNTIRIGGSRPVTATFIAGISITTVANGTQVFVTGPGQLGIASSSRRYKEEIADMGAESDLLMKLRPVSFYYKPELDETHTRQYGLVAEEVAQVAPQLVVFDKEGAPQTVRYHFVNAMLLNEVQKQRQLVELQQSTISRQQAEIQNLAARLAKLEALTTTKP